MKKNRPFFAAIIYFITLITNFNLSPAFANTAKAQEVMDTRVSIAFTGEALDRAVNKLETASKVKFAYDAEKLGLKNYKTAKRTFSAAKLGEVLSILLSNTNITYKELAGNILLQTKKEVKVQKPGKIYGKVFDDKGETLPGASVKIVELGRTISTAVDGSYSFSAEPGTYTLEVSYVSYQSKKVTDVTLSSDALIKLDIVLTPSSNALKNVTITSSFKKDAVAGLYTQQKNAASVTDGISAEQIARTPDNNMGQVMKRISGLSTVDNRYVVVRGLTERYNQGMVDGIVLPSTDMNRHNFSFDVIPVEMVSNVVVNKTATPDISAEFAGGQVSVNTLDIPLENFTILSLGAGANSNTLGKTFEQSGKRGKYDFLGFDDGHRKMPAGIQSWGLGPIPDYAVPQSKLFNNDAFKRYSSTGGLNQNYRLSAGRVYNLKNDQKWGFIAGLSLRNNQETAEYKNVRNMPMYQDYPRPRIAYIDSADVRRNGYIYKYNTTAGAQLNVGIQGKSYKIGLKNMFSQILNNSFDLSRGLFAENAGGAGSKRNVEIGIQTPEFTRILQNKLEGEHSLTGSGLKLTWLAGRTAVRQETRDRTKFSNFLTGTKDGIEYYQTPNIANPNITNPEYDYRIFTDTKETDYNWAANLSQSFNFLGDKSLVKAGYNGISKKRALDATTLKIRTEDRAFKNFDRPYEELMAPENIGSGAGQAYYLADESNGTQFDGKANFHAGYLMLDQRFLNRIRLVYGMRVEKYDLSNKQPQVNESGSVRSTTGEKNTNYLPSVNLTYSITPTMNFRASFSKTIIRPDFRETSYFGFYDVPLDALISGADLVSTKIKNTDLRYEWYPSPGEIVSISGFYKSFDKPIELVGAQETSGKVSEYKYQNQKDAVNYGIEMELRKSLGFIDDRQWLRNISLFGNGAIIKSKIHTLNVDGAGKISENKVTRALYGQSPYVINAGVSYTSADYGLTLNYNRSGRRTNTVSWELTRTEYENGRDLLDLQMFCRFLNKKLELKLNVGNLLNSSSFFYVNGNGYIGNGDVSTQNFSFLPYIGTDKYEKNFDDVRYRVKYGVSSSLSVTYKF